MSLLARHLRDAVAEAWGKPLTMNVAMPIAAVMLDLGFPSATVKAVPLLARTAGLLAHLAEEQEHPVGFLMAGKAEEAIDYEPREDGRVMLAPEVEAVRGPSSSRIDDAAYREQVAYLFDRSRFYREKLAEAGFASAPSGWRACATSRGCLSPRSASSGRAATPENPIGAHLCATPSEIVRIYSTSGTTGTPSYIPLTARDLDNWVTASARSYAASGITAGQRIVSTYNAGPFVAGAALAAFDRIGLCHIPVGTGNTERLMLAVELLEARSRVLTPSYAAYLVEWAADRGVDLAGVERPSVCSSRASPAAASRRFVRSSKRAGAPASPRRWESATSACRSGGSARSRTGCTSARAASSTPS